MPTEIASKEAHNAFLHISNTVVDMMANDPAFATEELKPRSAQFQSMMIASACLMAGAYLQKPETAQCLSDLYVEYLLSQEVFVKKFDLAELQKLMQGTYRQLRQLTIQMQDEGKDDIEDLLLAHAVFIINAATHDEITPEREDVQSIFRHLHQIFTLLYTGEYCK